MYTAAAIKATTATRTARYVVAAMLSNELDSCKKPLNFVFLLILSELLCLRVLTTIDFLVGVVELPTAVDEVFAWSAWKRERVRARAPMTGSAIAADFVDRLS